MRGEGGPETAQTSGVGGRDDPRSKRLREDDGAMGSVRKSMKVVQRADTRGPSIQRNHERTEVDVGPRSQPRSVAAVPISGRSQLAEQGRSLDHEPLFLPHSQMSTTGGDRVHKSGMGIETMNEEELAAMLEDEGEEVNADIGSQAARHSPAVESHDVNMHDEVDGNLLNAHEDMRQNDEDSFDLVDDDDFAELGPTQLQTNGRTGKV